MVTARFLFLDPMGWQARGTIYLCTCVVLLTAMAASLILGKCKQVEIINLEDLLLASSCKKKHAVIAEAFLQDEKFRDGCDDMRADSSRESFCICFSTAKKLLQSLGSDGLGVVGVSGLSCMKQLRQEILPLARALALLPPHEVRPILKANGLGTDVPLDKPGRLVSAFAAQLQLEVQDCDMAAMDCTSLVCSTSGDWEQSLGKVLREVSDRMGHVGLLIARVCDLALGLDRSKGLAAAIVEGGTGKARLIHYHSQDEQAKGNMECVAGQARSKKPRHRKGKAPSSSSVGGVCETSKASIDRLASNSHHQSVQSLWQQWHYDYGLLTVLTPPLFLCPKPPSSIQSPISTPPPPPLPGNSSPPPRCSTPSNLSPPHNHPPSHLPHVFRSCTTPPNLPLYDSTTPPDVSKKSKLSPTLQDASIALKPSGGLKRSELKFKFSGIVDADDVLPPGGHVGLCVLEKSTGMALPLEVPEDTMIFQVGEAAQILSGGRLRASAHCVLQPSESCWHGVSRETFVLFMQPRWDLPLVPPRGFTELNVLKGFKKWHNVNGHGKINDARGSEKVYHVDGHGRAEDGKDSDGVDVDICKAFRVELEGKGRLEDGKGLGGLEGVFEGIVPHLKERWSVGATFAEFSAKTTRGYYGAWGRQSKA